MSNRSLRTAWTHSDLTCAAFAVHLHVADVVSAEHDWLFFVKVAKIATACRVTPRSVQRARKYPNTQAMLGTPVNIVPR